MTLSLLCFPTSTEHFKLPKRKKKQQQQKLDFG